MPEPGDTPAADHCDVAIIGAGPAGLGAAARLRSLGVRRVVVIDREPQAGGIPRHCGHYPYGMREFRRLLRGPDYARRLVERARESGVEIRTATTVVRLEQGPRLVLCTTSGVAHLAAQRVILATGVRETSRAARLIGGQRPLGILSTGALQSMVYLQRLKPFARPVILGTELVSFSAILTCRHAGIRPVAMIESNARITARSAATVLPLALGMPVLLGHSIEAIRGDTRVQAVLVREPSGERREIACDGVIVSGRFTPESTLVRTSHLLLDAGTGGPVIDQYGRCSDPRCFAAGNLLRPVETAGWSWQEGVDTADRVAACLRGLLSGARGGCGIAPGDQAVRYVVPQRLALPNDGAGVAHAQIRLTRAAKGLLTLRANGRQLWTRRLSSLPERRILVPLAPLAGVSPDEDIRVGLTEDC